MTESQKSSRETLKSAPETIARERAGLSYAIDALVRDDGAGLRAVSITRRLVRLVSEFDVGSYAAVNIRTTDEQGRLEITLEMHGDAAREVTKADLVSALGEGVFLGDPVPTEAISLPDYGTAYELVRTAVAPMFRSTSSDFGRPEWMLQAELADGQGFAAPLPNENDSAEPLLAAMARSDQQLWVRTVLGPADELTAQIVVDELNASMTRQGLADYVRVPVLARTIAMSSTRVPVAVRAALRQRGGGLRLVPVGADESLPLWMEPMAALRSAAVAETHAVAIARIPTAGTMRALGVATKRPAVPERPLDPMPAPPKRPIRLGWAIDAFGKKVAVELDASDLVRHCYIEGQSGSGKTTTIAQLFWSITRAGYQVIYLDPHGDGAARAAAYSSTLGDTTSYYIRHGDREHPVRINPLAETDPESRERALSELLELIQNMLDPQHEGMVGERFKRTFTIVAQATFELFGSRTSITDVLALTITKESLRALASAVRPKSPDVASRLEAELFSLGDKEFTDLVSWFVSRLQPFLRTPALRDILGTGEDSVDVHDVLESGKNLIVDLASLELGEDVARVLGALWLLKVRNAMGHRTDRKREVVLLVDEAHLYTFGALPGLLAEARKFGIGIVIATQASDNLAPGLARAINANCGSHISLRTGIGSASAASERLGGWAPIQLTRLPDLTAAVSLSRGGVPTQAFTLHVDHFDVIAEEGWDELRIAAGAAEVAVDSLERLWAPYADRRVLSDAQVVASVKAAGAPRRRPMRTPSADDIPTSAHDAQELHNVSTGSGGSQHTDALLDRWLETRARISPSLSPDDAEAFDVVLDDKGSRWIEVIKTVREFTGMGLAEAKAASEGGGNVVITGTRDETRALVERLRLLGASARVVQSATGPKRDAQ
jgi:DNA helicase HerA-like ATPase